MKHILAALGALMLAWLCSAQASAADLRYVLTPVGGVGYSASWTLSERPIVTQAADGQGFAIERVEGTFPRSTGGDAYFDFYSASNGGGFMISDADSPRVLATLFGAQLYSGSEAAPVMRRGIFTLTTQGGGRSYILQAGAVPEPATWALMIGGFAMVGGAMRRRQAAVRYA